MEDLECGIKKGREQTIWNQFSTNIMILEPVGSPISQIIPRISSISCVGGCGDVGVFETEEIQHPIDSNRRYALACLSLDFRFGVEGYAESGFGEHREIVGTVSHGYGLGNVDVLHLSEEPEELLLAASVDNIPYISTRKLAVGTHFKLIGIHIVEVVFPLEPVAEICESSG